MRACVVYDKREIHAPLRKENEEGESTPAGENVRAVGGVVLFAGGVFSAAGHVVAEER